MNLLTLRQCDNNSQITLIQQISAVMKTIMQKANHEINRLISIQIIESRDF